MTETYAEERARLATEERELALTKALNSAYGFIAPWRRPGTIIHVTREGGKIAPAYFTPATGDVTIDLDEEGADITGLATVTDELRKVARRGDLDAVTDQDTAKAVGLIQHEAAHTRWSDWMEDLLGLVPVTKRQFAVLEMLEEIRIEKRAVDVGGPITRKMLRASFQMVIANAKPEHLTNAFGASHAWALTVGRVRSGIVEAREVEEIDNAARTLLGDDAIEVLSEILDEVVEIDLTSLYGTDERIWAAEQLLSLADAWLDALGEPEAERTVRCGHAPPTEEGEGESTSGPGGADTEGKPSESGEGEGDPSEKSGPGTDADDDDPESSKPEAGGFGEVGADASESTSEAAPANLTDEQAAELLAEMMEKAAAKVTEEWKADPDVRLSDADAEARKVFGGEARKSRAASRTTRKPTGEENTAAQKLASELERLAMPAIVKSAHSSLVPPGRLRSREALRATIEKKAGRMVTAEPWKSTRRRHTHVQPMTVGIMTDTSGSMGWAEQLVASAAYVTAHAGHRIGARFAAVTFGNKAEAIVRPNELPTQVTVRAADGGSEAFDQAAAAIDGVLRLTSTRQGAKVLIVVTDGYLVRPNEMQKAQMWVDRLRAGGTLVIQIAYTDAQPIAKGVQVMKVARPTVPALVQAIVRGLQTTMTHRG